MSGSLDIEPPMAPGKKKRKSVFSKLKESLKTSSKSTATEGESMGDLRKSLGIEKEHVSVAEHLDRLEQEANNDVLDQVSQYEQEQTGHEDSTMQHESSELPTGPETTEQEEYDQNSPIQTNNEVLYHQEYDKQDGSTTSANPEKLLESSDKDDASEQTTTEDEQSTPAEPSTPVEETPSGSFHVENFTEDTAPHDNEPKKNDMSSFAMEDETSSKKTTEEQSEWLTEEHTEHLKATSDFLQDSEPETKEDVQQHASSEWTSENDSSNKNSSIWSDEDGYVNDTSSSPEKSESVVDTSAIQDSTQNMPGSDELEQTPSLESRTESTSVQEQSEDQEGKAEESSSEEDVNNEHVTEEQSTEPESSQEDTEDEESDEEESTSQTVATDEQTEQDDHVHEETSDNDESSADEYPAQQTRSDTQEQTAAAVSASMDFDEQTSSLQNELHSLEQERERLHAETFEAKKELSDLESQIHQINPHELQLMKQTQDMLTHEDHDLQQDVNQLKQVIEESQKKIELLRKQEERLHSSIGQMVRKEQELSSVETTYDQDITKKQDTLASLEHSISDLHEQETGMQKDQDEVTHRVEALEDAAQKMQERLAVLKEEHAKLKREDSLLEKHKETLESENTLLQDQTHNLDHDMEQKKLILELQRKKIQDLSEHEKQLYLRKAGLSSQVALLDESLSTIADDVSQLQHQGTHLEIIDDMLLGQKEELLKLNENLVDNNTSIDHEIAQKKSVIEAQREKILSLQHHEDNLLSEQEGLSRRVDSLHDSVQTLTSRLRSTQEQLEDARKEKEHTTHIEHEKEHHIKQLDEQRRKLETDLRDAKTTIEKLHDEQASILKERESMKKELEDKESSAVQHMYQAQKDLQALEAKKLELLDLEEHIEKNGFEAYLSSRLHEIQPTSIVGSAPTDMIVLPAELDEIVKACRIELSKNNVSGAKELYMKARNSFMSGAYPRVQRDLVHGVIRELYDDITIKALRS